VTRTDPVDTPPTGRGEHPPGRPLASAVVDCALYCGGVRVPGRLPLEEAAEKARSEPGAFVWLGLHQPDAAAFHAAAREFDLHPFAVEDAVNAHQRPKLETYGDRLFVVLKTVRYLDDEEVVDTGEVMVFVGDDFVVTVRHGDPAALGPVRRDLEARPELMRLGPSAVLWAVCDAVVDGYTPALDGVMSDVDEVEDQVFSESRQNPTRRIYTLKREVLEFSRAVQPLVDATERLARGDLPALEPRLTHSFRDVHDHVLRVAERVSGLDALLQSALDANVAQVTLQQNEDMRKISSYAAILTVCTTIAGIYGMNFDHMPELHWQLGYPYALLLMGGVSVVMYRAFRRNGWL
jgi:magnesium transporter